MTHQQDTVLIPKPLIESLEIALAAHGRRFLTEVAGVLRIPPKDLIRNVLAHHPKVSIGLLKSEETQFTCKWILVEGKHGHYCADSTVLGSKYCSKHGSGGTIKSPLTQTQFIGDKNPVRRLVGNKKLYWVNEDNFVLDIKGQIIGFYVEEDDEVVLYTFD